MRRILTTTTIALFAATAMGSAARADFGEGGWWKSFAITGYVDAGIMGNTTGSTAGTNWGRLFDDRANRLELNQFALMASRPLDPNADDFDFGFTIQGMYGSDARYTHLIGLFDRASDTRNQFTFIELDAQFHLPWTIGGGTDAKVGIYPSILSAETTVPYNATSNPPAGNPFYSHSYIFNYGITVAHTGFFTVTHVTPMVDVYAGFDTGNQTTWFKRGDNNSSVAGTAGVGLHLLGGNLTPTLLVHMGPENPTGTTNLAGRLVDGSMRYESTLTTVWTVNSNLTLTTDLNFARDNGFSASAYGIAQYASYALTDMLTLQARGEIWRDDKGFFVAAYPGSLDPLNVLVGRPNTSISAFPSAVTYAEITLGVNIKPVVPEPLGTLLIRPEIRYDTTTNNIRPFNNGRSKSSFTIGTDVILTF